MSEELEHGKLPEPPADTSDDAVLATEVPLRPGVDAQDPVLVCLETRILTLTRQIMGMERMLANMDALGADTDNSLEAIGSAYTLLGLYRRRRNAWRDE